MSLIKLCPLFAIFAWTATAQETLVLPDYRPEQAVSGVIRSWGSPHMAGLLRNWEAGFRKFHPDVFFSDYLKGSASATYGFAENVAELGLMGRQIYTFEYYGVYRRSLMLPVEIEVATGSFNVPHKSFALAVFVHRDNPLARLTEDDVIDMLVEELRPWLV